MKKIIFILMMSGFCFNAMAGFFEGQVYRCQDSQKSGPRSKITIDRYEGEEGMIFTYYADARSTQGWTLMRSGNGMLYSSDIKVESGREFLVGSMGYALAQKNLDLDLTLNGAKQKLQCKLSRDAN